MPDWSRVVTTNFRPEGLREEVSEEKREGSFEESWAATFMTSRRGFGFVTCRLTGYMSEELFHSESPER